MKTKKTYPRTSYFMFGVVILAIFVIALLEQSSARGSYGFLSSFTNDISIKSVSFSPLSSRAGEAVTIFGNVRNEGSDVIESYRVEIDFGDGFTSLKNYNTALRPGEFSEYSFTKTYMEEGTYTAFIRVFTDGDYKQENNEIMKTIEVQVASGKLDVKSEPEGALVFVDNILVGVTPAEFELGAGTHSLRLSKEGYKFYDTKFQIFADQSTVINADMQIV